MNKRNGSFICFSNNYISGRYLLVLLIIIVKETHTLINVYMIFKRRTHWLGLTMITMITMVINNDVYFIFFVIVFSGSTYWSRIRLKVTVNSSVDQTLLPLCTLHMLFFLFSEVFPILRKNYRKHDKKYRKRNIHEIYFSYWAITSKEIELDTKTFPQILTTQLNYRFFGKMYDSWYLDLKVYYNFSKLPIYFTNKKKKKIRETFMGIFFYRHLKL